MDDDPELAAIRAKLRQEMMDRAASSPSSLPSPSPPPPPLVPDIPESAFEPFVRAQENAVIDCWAPWCGPCKVVGPIVEELAREMAGRVAFAKLNVDLAPRVSQAFGVQSIPTLLVFRRERLLDRIVGAYPKPQLAGMLERHFGRRSSGTPGPRRM